MRLVVATHNAHKIREISEILPDFEIVADNPEGIEEDAPDFVGNALIKVRAIASRHAGCWCLADDSGLEVAALGGAPGVRSARYAGEPADTAKNNALLLKNLEGAGDRRANFTCAVALVDPSGKEHTAVGKCFGRIALAPSGSAGFGYDPLFIPDGHDVSFADLSPADKNAISHRGRALAEVQRIIEASPDGSVRSPNGHPWLRLLRIVNLPTVPGDVLVGAAAALYAAQTAHCPLPTVHCAGAAIGASVAAYLYGLIDNDIAGASTDTDRPIPQGLISLAAARVARGFCWGVVLIIGALGSLPPLWWLVTLLLFGSMIAYNRLKKPFLMGLCRGLNVLAGAAAVTANCQLPTVHCSLIIAAPAVIWFLYIWWVTRYSEGEDLDPAKRKTVGFLIGALIYLQLGALVLFTLLAPGVPGFRPLLLTGAVMLVLLRVLKGLFPKVSAS